MFLDKNFEPMHIEATRADLAGNSGIGRYVLLPGSDGRASQIAERGEPELKSVLLSNGIQ